MRRLCLPGLLIPAIASVPAVAWAGPPSLPPADATEAPADGTDSTSDTAADGAPGDPGSPGDGSAGADGGTTLDAGAEGSFDIEGGAGGDAGADGDGDLGSAGPEPATTGAGLAGDGSGDGTGEILVDEDAAGPGVGGEGTGPGMSEGRVEPVMNTLRGPVGLFYTSLPNSGGKYTFRMRLHTDFFRKKGFFCCAGDDPDDEHGRVRGGVTMGFTVAKWGELYFAASGAANRNSRDQPDRQDPPSVFALGDLDFGFKGGWGFVNGGGVGVGGQIGLGLISGSERLRTERVNFNIDAIVNVDLRYLTKKEVPVRFTTNIGWMLDNSIRLVAWGDVEDDLSREVLRFSLGANHSRVRTRYAVDFPVRFGKQDRFGIDPVIEYSWEFATYREDSFEPLTAAFGGSPLPRSQAWLTLGARANPYDGLQISAAVDIGTTSPNYEFGPPVAPWQLILGIGWSFDPKPRIKEVEKEGEILPPPPMAMLDGRIVGRVVDPQGNPVADAKITFPGAASNAIITDEAGMFTSFRFPKGEVTVVVETKTGATLEQTATITPEQDTELELVVEGGPSDAVLQGKLMDADGAPIGEATVHVTGQGIDEPFTCCNAEGLFAVALPLGEYTAKITAPGFAEKRTSFTVTAEGGSFEEALDSDKPIETPNVSGNKNRLRIKKSIRYKNEDLDDRSFAILDEVAAFLKGHPEFKLVQIQVHTDDRGNPKKRSQARADAVKTYLEGKGVDGSRIDAKGFGDSNPVAVNLTDANRRKNNRTILRVREYEPKSE